MANCRRVGASPSKFHVDVRLFGALDAPRRRQIARIANSGAVLYRRLAPAARRG